MAKDLTELSRAASRALRHQPWLYEIELDDEGWATIKSVLTALRTAQPDWADLSESDLAAMIEGCSKRRHEVKAGRIRALYGHSVAGRFKRSVTTPPDVLYHGTAPHLVSIITSSGLLPMRRQYVHLSVDEASAVAVGKRKVKTPTILRVLARDAHGAGVRFYEGNEMVWLADAVPPQFIEAK